MPLPADAQLRSEEIQDVMQQTPGWIIRWGITVLLSLLALLLVGTYFIRYPDVVEARFVLAASAKPVVIRAGQPGTLGKIMVRNQARVRKNAPLFLWTSEARYEDIAALKNLLVQVSSQPDLAAASAPAALRIGPLTHDYGALAGYLRAGNRDSAEVVQKRLWLQIRAWEEAHFVRAASAGQVYFSGPWEAGDSIGRDSALVTIVPGGGKYRIRGKLPVAGSGSVQVGQRAMLKFDAYPSREFGAWEGRVSTISPVAADGYLDITITPLGGPGAASGKNAGLALADNLQGKAEILTNDRSLLERLFGFAD